jgi:hypothetical protein
VILLHALAQAATDGGALLGPEGGEGADPVGELLRVLTREALLRLEQAVEDRVRGEYRNAARGRLVDDLVRRAGAHVVHERVARGEELRDTSTGHGVRQGDALAEAELAHQTLELLSMRALVGRERRAVDVEPGTRDLRDRTENDLQPFRPRVATEREEREAFGPCNSLLQARSGGGIRPAGRAVR